MILIFKKHNKDWSKTLTIMTDKDFSERNIFLQEFPQANLLICLYHVLRTFRREITSDKMGITAAERLHVLDILQRMSYATKEETYFGAYKELQQTGLKTVLDYFNDNWHQIRNEWVCGLKDHNLMFQNHTNNRVESINQKLKSVISKFARLPQFCCELLKVSHRTRPQSYYTLSESSFTAISKRISQVSVYASGHSICPLLYSKAD